MVRAFTRRTGFRRTAPRMTPRMIDILPPADGRPNQVACGVELRRRIEDRLCELGNLITGQFPVTRRGMVRGGREVGAYYCVHGPRSVKLTAIHDAEAGEVIFYGSDGVRRESMPV